MILFEGFRTPPFLSTFCIAATLAVYATIACAQSRDGTEEEVSCSELERNPAYQVTALLDPKALRDFGKDEDAPSRADIGAVPADNPLGGLGFVVANPIIVESDYGSLPGEDLPDPDCISGEVILEYVRENTDLVISQMGIDSPPLFMPPLNVAQAFEAPAFLEAEFEATGLGGVISAAVAKRISEGDVNLAEMVFAAYGLIDDSEPYKSYSFENGTQVRETPSTFVAWLNSLDPMQLFETAYENGSVRARLWYTQAACSAQSYAPSLTGGTIIGWKFFQTLEPDRVRQSIEFLEEILSKDPERGNRTEYNLASSALMTLANYYSGCSFPFYLTELVDGEARPVPNMEKMSTYLKKHVQELGGNSTAQDSFSTDYLTQIALMTIFDQGLGRAKSPRKAAELYLARYREASLNNWFATEKELMVLSPDTLRAIEAQLTEIGFYTAEPKGVVTPDLVRALNQLLGTCYAPYGINAPEGLCVLSLKVPATYFDP